MARYYVVAGVAGAVQVGVMLLLSVALGLHETLANLAGISAGIAINFFVNNLWTFRADDAPAPGLPTSPEAHPEHAASTQHP
jgi:putative flippase GtrA